MPAAFVSSEQGTLVSTTAATTAGLVVNRPAGIVTGNLLLAVVSETGAGGVITPPSGWTTDPASMVPAAGPGLATSYLFWKYATASEPASYTFTWSSPTARPYALAGSIHQVSGAPGPGQGSPFEGVAIVQTAAATHPAAPGETPSAADSTLLSWWGTSTGDVINAPSSMTARTQPRAAGVSQTTADEALATTAATGARTATTYFPLARWLHEPIPANPVLDRNNTLWAGAGYLGATGPQRSLSLVDFAATLKTADTSTPRFDIAFANVPSWGPDPFPGTMPVPAGTRVPPGSDGHVSVADASTNAVYSLWQATPTPDPRAASYGGLADLNGDGVETAGSSTAGRLSRYAGVMRAADLTAAAAANTGLPYALFCSSDIVSINFRVPSTKADAVANPGGVATPIPNGTRIQLDPTINVDALANITPGEKVIAKTLQTHGAYIADKGGSRLGFICELQPDGVSGGTPGAAYVALGWGWDYWNMTHIPWTSIRVLASWNGAADTAFPSTPTNVVASNITATGFTLNWTPSTDNVGVFTYSVQLNGTTVVKPFTNTATLTGLTANTPYTVRIVAADSANNFGGLSAPITVTTTA